VVSTLPEPSGAPALLHESGGWTIEVSGLRKRFGDTTAIDDLSFAVQPGQVCGFLGPNGAGKTTTLRCILGLIAPTSGTTTIGGQRYADLTAPLATVGAMLDATGFHPGRSARNHLRVLCASAGFADGRADEMLELVGLLDYSSRSVGSFSTGMRQRLGLAGALLGDPSVLVLDEPATGLDPAGINWLRELVQHLAHDRNKTILLSSHLLSEIEHTADRVVIISRGRLVREGTLADLIDRARRSVRVLTPEPDRLRDVLNSLGVGVGVEEQKGVFVVSGTDPATVGHVAFTNGIELHELTAQHEDLEALFLQLTGPPPEHGDET
jgi:ABC-2 type transport system ATP-binding protein